MSDFGKWLFETAKAQALFYAQSVERESMEPRRVVIEYGDKPYIVKQGEREIQRFARCDDAEQFAKSDWPTIAEQKDYWRKRDQELAAIEAGCDWFDHQIWDEKRERDRDLEHESRLADEQEHGPERDQSEGESISERNK